MMSPLTWSCVVWQSAVGGQRYTHCKRCECAGGGWVQRRDIAALANELD